MPTFKIDGKEIPFQDGDTILRAAYREGIDIPYYCWHPGLSIAANCRMCLVEVLPPPGRAALQLDVLRLNDEGQGYVVEKKPKLQPACQVTVADGMEVLSDSSPHVIRARHSVQEFLLLNHPVDCPICDQAGECKLQDYWLEHQATKKRMLEEIQHKPKAVVFGPHIVYDAERCILCTRCVRFCDEYVKDPVLSIRERGNLNEIIVAPGRQLDNAYSLMTAHICPVGALTSGDFRFKARVWFLRSAKSICQGCATGCNAWLDYDPRFNKVYRYRPRENMQVNEYWMCDEGMVSYRWANENRATEPRVNGKVSSPQSAMAKAAELLRAGPVDSVGFVLSAQHSNEDNFALVQLARHLGVKELYLTGKPAGEGDDILRSADKNPNTAGAKQVAGSLAVHSFEELLEAVASNKIKCVIALGAAVPGDAAETVGTLRKLEGMVSLSPWSGPLSEAATIFIPACSWAEATGTYVNAKGIAQLSNRAIHPINEARPAWQIIGSIRQALGHPAAWTKLKDVQSDMSPQQPSEAAAQP